MVMDAVYVLAAISCIWLVTGIEQEIIRRYRMKLYRLKKLRIIVFTILVLTVE